MKRIIALIVFIFFTLGMSQVHGQVLKDFVKKQKERIKKLKDKCNKKK